MTIKSITARLNAWRRYRASVRELSQLSDRELSDLGLNRYDIDGIARRSAESVSLGMEMGGVVSRVIVSDALSACSVA